MSAPVEIVALPAPLADGVLAELAGVLVDCVEGGASVSFLSPLPLDQALGFFRRVAVSVAAGDTVLLAARLDGRVVGTVQLGLDTPLNNLTVPTSKKCSCIVPRAAAVSARP